VSALLEVRDLERRFSVRGGGLPWRRPSTLHAVGGVSFDVAPGRTLGLVGESGCGKSTTARLVLGLMTPTAGSVRFEGVDVPSERGARWRALRRRMQMVYQDPLGALDRRLPVDAQVAEPLDIAADGRRAERIGRAHELMAAVGLTPNLYSRYPHELSGGQRQRVVLARALIVRPALLVCDEPVSALDVSIQAQVVNLLRDLQSRFGVAYLFISHDLKVVRQVSDEVAVMYLGRIVEQGPPDDLFHRPQHPYTQALVSAIPSPWRGAADARVMLEGDPPSPSALPAGCAFHPRCPVAMPACRVERPALVDLGAGRRAACHRLVPSGGTAPC